MAADSGASLRKLKKQIAAIAEASLMKRRKKEASRGQQKLFEAMIREFESPPDDEVCRRHRKQVAESDGFDVVDFPEDLSRAELAPCPVNFLKDIQMTYCANLALYHYNYHAKTTYIFSKVLTANTAAYMFYITFEAAEKGNHDSAAAVKTFQAKVFQRQRISGTQVFLCRLKNECDEKGAFVSLDA